MKKRLCRRCFSLFYCEMLVVAAALSIVSAGFIFTAVALNDEGILSDITIINVYSYPSVGGRWIVMFTAVGHGNLTITGMNGTTLSSTEKGDVKFLEIKHGDRSLDYKWGDNSVFIHDFSYSETCTVVLEVLTTGRHVLKFQFGKDVEYAYNQAGVVKVIYLHSRSTVEFYDDFEDGNIAGWTTSGTGDAGAGTYTANSGTYSMHTRWDQVTVTSSVVDLSSVNGGTVNYWIRRGADWFSEDPDGGEDLVVEYLNDTGTWITLDTFLGDDTPGQIYTSVHSLSTDALHPNFQIRFTQLSGSGIDYDYWHIDDVNITSLSNFMNRSQIWNGVTTTPFDNSNPYNTYFEPNFAGDMHLQGTVNVTVYLEADDSLDSTVTAYLYDSNGGDVLIGSGSVTVPADTDDWYTISVSGVDYTIQAGRTLRLMLETATADQDVILYLDDSSYPSRVELPAKSFINVDWVKTYDPNLGIEKNSFLPGATVLIKANVSDPFGTYDISGANITIESPNGTTLVDNQPMNVELMDSSPLPRWILYNYTYVLSSGAEEGFYNVQVNATENDGVTNSTTTTFTVSQYGVTIYPDQTKIADPGTRVNFTFTIENVGTLNDTYNVTVSSSSMGWRTDLYDTDGAPLIASDNDGDGVWDYVSSSYDNGFGVPEIGVEAGGKHEVVLSKDVPSGAAPASTDTTVLTVTSQNNSVVYNDVVATTSILPDEATKALYLHSRSAVEFYDDFEDGDISGWTVSGSDAGAGTYTANSGSYSMYTRWGSVSVTSSVVDLGGAEGCTVGYWVRRGADSFSEDPDSGEDLVVEYLNDTGVWVTLDTFLGEGTDGQIYDSLHSLSSDALHTGFQIRFTQTGGSGVDYDYWHVDDVNVTSSSGFMNRSEVWGGLATAPFDGGNPYDSYLEPGLAGALHIEGTVNVTVYLQADDTLDSVVTAYLYDSDGGVTLIGSGSVTVPANNDGWYTIGISGVNYTVPGGNTLLLRLETASADQDVVLYLDDSSYPSRVELPAKSFISVDWVRTYDANSGVEKNSFLPGETVLIRANVSDPFGSYDIAGAVVDITSPFGSQGDLVDDASMVEEVRAGGWILYNYSYMLPLGAEQGVYAVDVTATENDGVTSTNSTTFIGLSSPPMINSYDLRNTSGSKLNNITGLLKVNNEYYFTINITDPNGWSDIEYINVTCWYDNGNESSVYNGTEGGNLNMFLQYENTTGVAEYKMLWPDNEAQIIPGNCSETIINSTTRIINICFKPLNQVRWANSNDTWDSTQNTTNDPYSWNFNITAAESADLKNWKTDEYGVYRYTYILPDSDWIDVVALPGFSDNSSVVTITYSSNYDFNMSIYFEENLTHTLWGYTIPIAGNVTILADADPNDDIVVDKVFGGIGETNAIDIFNDSGVFHVNNVSQTVDVQFRVYIPLGTMGGKYVARVATKISHD